MSTKLILGSIMALAVGLLPSAAFAEGAVKVECFGHCDLVTLGQICDTYSAGSEAVAVACDDTALGTGTNATCGSATCRPYGALNRNDHLSDYCDDGPGYDAVVSCRTGATLMQASTSSPKVDDGAGKEARE